MAQREKKEGGRRRGGSCNRTIKGCSVMQTGCAATAEGREAGCWTVTIAHQVSITVQTLQGPPLRPEAIDSISLFALQAELRRRGSVFLLQWRDGLISATAVIR